MSNIPSIDEQDFWKLLEMVASPNGDMDTELLADALNKIANGDPDDREAGIEAIHMEMAKCLQSRPRLGG